MNITQETRLADILQEYPWLKEEMTKVSDKFKMLNTPVGRIMLKKATIGEMSKRSGVETDQIISKLTKMIESHTR